MMALPENAIEPAVASARPGHSRWGRGTGVVVSAAASVGVEEGSGAIGGQLTRATRAPRSHSRKNGLRK